MSDDKWLNELARSRETEGEGEGEGGRHDWRDDFVERWGEKYIEVKAVRVDADRVWVYAHNLAHMIVKEYGFRVSRDGVVYPDVRGRLVYCGPVVVKGPRGFYVFANGRLVDVVEDLNAIYDVLVHRLSHVSGCFDVDVEDVVAPKVPAQRAQAVLVAGRTPFTTLATGTIDWARGRDLMGLLRTGEPDETARALKAREEVLRKYYGDNFYPALAVESLYIAATLIRQMKRVSRTAVNSWIYVYGTASLGKSILAKNLAEMWCATEECEDAYLLYVAGPLNENRLRNAMDIEGPVFIADEQDRDSVVKLLRMLGTATSDVIGVHAARHGRGFETIFKVNRGIVVVTNVPVSDVIARVDATLREAVKRRLLVVPWAPAKIDKEVARQLIQELRSYTPPLLNFVSEVYNKCRGRVQGVSDTLELAKAFWQCATEVFGVDFGERIRALEWVEKVQQEEKASREVDELYELWATVKAYYRVSTDAEALLRLLDDRTAVEYTERGAADRWNSVFKRICGGGVDVSNPNDVFIAVARCLYNVDVGINMAETVLNRSDVELIKKVVALVLSNRYPWVKAPSWLIPHKRREVGGVQHVRDPVRNIYRYDLIAEFLIMLYTSKEGETEGESKEESFTSDQGNFDTTVTTFTTWDSQKTSDEYTESNTSHTSKELNADTGDKFLGGSGSKSSKIVNNLESTNISQKASLDSDGCRNCIKSKYAEYMAKYSDHARALREAMRECPWECFSST